MQAFQSTASQAHVQPSLRSAFSHVIRQQGLLSLWKGNGVTVIHRLPYSAINFWAYERLTQVWRQNVKVEDSSHAVDFSRRLLFGGMAGSLACAVVRIIDIIIIIIYIF